MSTVKSIMNPKRRQSKEQKDMLSIVSKLEGSEYSAELEDNEVEMDLSELGLPQLPTAAAEEAEEENNALPTVHDVDEGWESAAPPAPAMDFDAIMKNAAQAVSSFLSLVYTLVGCTSV
jgi:hypothetical protein